MPKVPKEAIELFEQIEAGFPGCWSDIVLKNKEIIESNKCPSCRSQLEYRGFSNPEVYRAFGVCEPCRFAKQFYSEGAELVKTKKEICKRVKKSERAAA